MKKSLFAIAFSCLLAAHVRADDWPQFGGPNRDGVSKEKGLLKDWPKGGPTLAWTFQDAGLGFSSLSIAKGIVYTLGTDKGFKDEYVIALDEKKGTELWRVKFAPLFTFPQNTWGDGPRSTPIVDGNLVFALNGSGILACVDSTQKKIVWQTNLSKDLGGEMMTQWGYSESPLVDGDHLICTPGGDKGTLAALDKKTGKVIWRSTDWTEKSPYSSMIAADIHGVRQYIQAGYTGGSAGASLAGVDAKTGKLLWSGKIASSDSYSISPTPIVSGNQVYFTSTEGCHLFEISKKQQAKELYKKANWKKLKNRDGGVVRLGDSIFGHSEPGMWVCQDFKTGDPDWTERDTFKCASGSIVAADGMLYLFSDEGEVGLAAADPKEMKLVSQFKLPMLSKIPGVAGTTSSASRRWAHPAIANGHLYLRDHDLIFAFKITK